MRRPLTLRRESGVTTDNWQPTTYFSAWRKRNCAVRTPSGFVGREGTERAEGPAAQYRQRDVTRESGRDIVRGMAILLGLCLALLLAAGLGLLLYYTAAIPWWPATQAMLFASAGATAVVYTYLVVTRALDRMEDFKKRKDFIRVIDVLIRAVSSLLCAYGLFLAFPVVVHALSDQLSSFRIRLVVVALVYAVGYLAHAFKQRNQSTYGSLEVIFGLACAFKFVAHMDFGRVLIYEWAALIGCCYIVTRGMNNMQEAKQRVPEPLSSSAAALHPGTRS